MLRWCSPEGHTNSQSMFNDSMQKCQMSSFTANIFFLCMVICIQKLQGRSTSDFPVNMCSEWCMAWSDHISELVASVVWYIDPSTGFWYIYPYFVSYTHASSSPWFPWSGISNWPNPDHVHHVWAERSAVWSIDWSSITVIIHHGLRRALPAPSLTCMTPLTSILLVNFVSNLVFPFSINSNGKHNIKPISRLLTSLGV